MSMAADEAATIIMRAASLYHKAIEDQLNCLAENDVDFTVSYTALKNDRGHWSLKLNDPSNVNEKFVKQILYLMRDAAYNFAAIIRSLGFNTDVKISSKKGILIIWKKVK